MERRSGSGGRTMSVCDAAFIADIDKIKMALRMLEEATDNCSGGHLKQLNHGGYLPTGIMNYLLVIR